MLHPPYSPDLALSYYYLFRTLQNSLNGECFNADEAAKSHLVQFFADRDQTFYDRVIMRLPKKYQKENISLIKVRSLNLKKCA